MKTNLCPSAVPGCAFDSYGAGFDFRPRYVTPTERLAVEIESLRAQLTLKEEQIFFLVAEVARLNAGKDTNYKTKPSN